jgi:hypothetical protein
MTEPPAAGPGTQEAAGAGPRGKEAARKLSPYVRVVNPVWNGSGFIKRKKADFYVKQKRGTFLNPECNQLLLDMTHPENIAASESASIGYAGVDACFQWRSGISDGATVFMAEKHQRRVAVLDGLLGRASAGRR